MAENETCYVTPGVTAVIRVPINLSFQTYLSGSENFSVNTISDTLSFTGMDELTKLGDKFMSMERLEEALRCFNAGLVSGITMRLQSNIDFEFCNNEC